MVDALDRAIFLQLATVPATDPADATQDGQSNIEDLYRQNITPADISANGVTDAADTTLLTNGLRVGESAAMRAQRR